VKQRRPQTLRNAIKSSFYLFIDLRMLAPKFGGTKPIISFGRLHSCLKQRRDPPAGSVGTTADVPFGPPGAAGTNSWPAVRSPTCAIAFENGRALLNFGVLPAMPLADVGWIAW
jgi:hypothetical protein